jgi:hypothetical protein
MLKTNHSIPDMSTSENIKTTMAMVHIITSSDHQTVNGGSGITVSIHCTNAKKIASIFLLSSIIHAGYMRNDSLSSHDIKGHDESVSKVLQRTDLQCQQIQNWISQHGTYCVVVGQYLTEAGY